MAVDKPAKSLRAQAILGWQPTRVGLISDIDAGHYFG